MNCPTCKHDMLSRGYANGGTIWHCPRCGTVQHYDHFADGPPSVFVPNLVDRCRAFVDDETTAALESMKQAIGME